MFEERAARVLANMERMGLEQMIISDPPSVFYLTGKWILPNERLLALYLNRNGNHRLIAECTNHEKPLGIDKKMAAKFLLELMELGAAASYKNGSECVDGARRIKGFVFGG